MTVVKGSKLHRVKIVEDRPGQRVVLMLVLLVVFTGSVLVSYYLGHFRGGALQQQAKAEAASLKTELADSQIQVKSLQQSLANIELGAEVDRQANEEVRQQVIELKERIAVLDEENSFYKGLMAPSETRKGLTIGAVEITDTESPRKYNYKVVMQQLATNHTLLSGSLTFTVFGRSAEQPVSYNIGQISDQYKGSSIKLRYKYFQTITGELVLPDGFEPEAIELVANSTGKNATTVKKRFGWLVQEI